MARCHYLLSATEILKATRYGNDSQNQNQYELRKIETTWWIKTKFMQPILTLETDHQTHGAAQRPYPDRDPRQYHSDVMWCDVTLASNFTVWVHYKFEPVDFSAISWSFVCCMCLLSVRLSFAYRSSCLCDHLSFVCIFIDCLLVCFVCKMTGCNHLFVLSPYCYLI